MPILRRNCRRFIPGCRTSFRIRFLLPVVRSLAPVWGFQSAKLAVTMGDAAGSDDADNWSRIPDQA